MSCSFVPPLITAEGKLLISNVIFNNKKVISNKKSFLAKCYVCC